MRCPRCRRHRPLREPSRTAQHRSTCSSLSSLVAAVRGRVARCRRVPTAGQPGRVDRPSDAAAAVGREEPADRGLPASATAAGRTLWEDDSRCVAGHAGLQHPPHGRPSLRPCDVGHGRCRRGLLRVVGRHRPSPPTRLERPAAVGSGLRRGARDGFDLREWRVLAQRQSAAKPFRRPVRLAVVDLDEHAAWITPAHLVLGVRVERVTILGQHRGPGRLRLEPE